jgi:hypothetical protein
VGLIKGGMTNSVKSGNIAVEFPYLHKSHPQQSLFTKTHYRENDLSVLLISNIHRSVAVG